MRRLEDLRLRYEKDGAVFEIFVPARTVPYLHDAGVGLDYVLEGMAKLAAKQPPPTPPKEPMASPRLGERPFVRSDGSWRPLTAIDIELFLRDHPGSFDIVSLVVALYGCLPEEAHKRLYERRGKKNHHTSTTFYNGVSHALQHALAALTHEGWTVRVEQANEGFMARKTWHVQAPSQEAGRES